MDTKLYPGIAFSPQAVLTDNIGAADTIIPVSNVSAFPDAPNLATIGTDEEGETVLYTAKTDTALSGCTRGVEGAAQTWSAGEAIGRNWTAKDHNDLIVCVEETCAEANGALAAAEAAQNASLTALTSVGSAQDTANGALSAAKEAQDAASVALASAKSAQAVSDAAQEAAGTAVQSLAAHEKDPEAHGDIREALTAKQDALTGQPGQVVGFDGSGAAVAVRGWSNQNFIDNGGFDIWQKGTSIDVSGGIVYTADRWHNLYQVCKYERINNQFPDCLCRYAMKMTCLKDGQYAQVYQPIEPELAALLDGKTVTISAWVMGQTAAQVTVGLNSFHAKWADMSGQPQRISGTGIFSSESAISVTLNGNTKTGDWYMVTGVKLELSEAPTPYVPADPALELLKCQRYYRVYATQAARPAKALDCSPVMRIDPAQTTITINGVTHYVNDANL